MHHLSHRPNRAEKNPLEKKIIPFPLSPNGTRFFFLSPPISVSDSNFRLVHVRDFERDGDALLPLHAQDLHRPVASREVREGHARREEGGRKQNGGKNKNKISCDH